MFLHNGSVELYYPDVDAMDIKFGFPPLPASVSPETDSKTVCFSSLYFCLSLASFIVDVLSSDVILSAVLSSHVVVALRRDVFAFCNFDGLLSLSLYMAFASLFVAQGPFDC